MNLRTKDLNIQVAQEDWTREESILSAVQLQRTFKELGFRPKKSLGQHFLVDTCGLHSLLDAADLSPDDIVVEVGPGLGVLTKEIARRVRQVVAVEVDGRLVSYLRQSMSSFSNCSVVHADILRSNPAILLSTMPAGLSEYKVIADLPYYITSAVLRHFLESHAKPSRMVVMVQEEVGETIVAESGKMSLLSVSVQFYGKPAIISHVPSSSFYPPPKVDSVILMIDLYQQPPIEVPSTEEFFHVVRAGFSARRKQLRNALALGLGLSPPDAVVILEEADVSPQRRAESLSLSEWARLCRVVVERKGN